MINLLYSLNYIIKQIFRESIPPEGALKTGGFCGTALKKLLLTHQEKLVFDICSFGCGYPGFDAFFRAALEACCIQRTAGGLFYGPGHAPLLRAYLRRIILLRCAPGVS
jgi:hypothetical protein